MNSTGQNLEKLSHWASRVFLLLGGIQLGAVIYWFLEGNQRWEVGPIHITIHGWEDTLAKATVVLALGLLLRPRPWLPARRLVRLLDPESGADPCPVRVWTVYSLIPGAGCGAFLAFYDGYRFPGWGLKLAVIAAVILGGALLHFLWALFFSKVPLLLYRNGPDDFRSSLRGGFYSLIWINLFFYYLLPWEGWYFESLRPLAGGLVLGVVLVLALRLTGSGEGGFLARRKRVLLILGGAWTSAALVGGVFYHYRLETAPAPRDRVIFITLDTTRRDHLSCYGYERRTSPRIDSVAASGVRFDHAICPMGITDPSHASMFTGTYPRTHGTLDVAYPITGAVSSLPEYFLDRGFRTAAIVSRGRLQPSTDLNLPGFEYENSPRGKGKQITGPHTFRRAANWLTEHRTEDAFIWVHFYDAHRIYQYHPDFPVRFADGPQHCEIPNWPPQDYKVTAREFQDCRDLYDGEIVYMDYWVGRLLDWVNQLEPKSERPPLVVLVADHGESLGEDFTRPLRYGVGHGGDLYNPLLRIPLIISWPGRIPEGKVAPDLTEVIDLAPTIVDLIFGGHDFSCQGQDLVPIMEGRATGDDFGVAQRTPYKEEWDRPAFAPTTYALFEGNYKLLSVMGVSEELYDLSVDPHEQQDLGATRTDQRERLARDLDSWLARTPESAPEKPNLSDEERDVLRDLGYIQ